jgi:hypothetical protein
MKILADDDYLQIEQSQIIAGDIVVYFSSQNGDAEHSGLVVENYPGQGPRVLSKWGSLHEVVHYLRNCPYDASNVKFYRVSR